VDSLLERKYVEQSSAVTPANTTGRPAKHSTTEAIAWSTLDHQNANHSVDTAEERPTYAEIPVAFERDGNQAKNAAIVR
jgi:hypothetical protein